MVWMKSFGEVLDDEFVVDIVVFLVLRGCGM